MSRFTPIPILAVLCALGPAMVSAQGAPKPKPKAPAPAYSGMCDASAALAVGSDRFLVANDEDNILRLYRADQPGRALVSRDITDFLALENPQKEADIEGSAALGKTLYWITSHGRNKEGKIKSNRYQFFALALTDKGGAAVSIAGVGKPYTHLMQDLLADQRLERFKLDPLTKKDDPKRAPEKEGSTNIEGLCAWRDSQLLIAFRNPIPDGKALLVPLTNPARVIEGDKAVFGDPIQLDLGGLGVRSIERLPGSTYLIVAGPFDDHGAFQLYQWSGDLAQQPERIQGADLSNLNPEAIVVYPKRNKVQLLSDDGGEPVGTIPACKDLPDPWRKTFRHRWVSLPPK